MARLRFYLERMLRLFLFYILLQATTTAMEYGYDRDLDDQPEFSNYGRSSKHTRYDQILSNLHSLFKERASDAQDDSKGVDDYNDLVSNIKTDDKQQIDEVLAEVTFALDKIKKELIQFNNDGVLTVEMPAAKHNRRYKRDVTNDTVTNVTSTENNVTETATTTEKPVMVTEEDEVTGAKNETVKTEVVSANNDTSTPDTSLNGRRMIPMMANLGPPATTSRVKNKLLSYLEDTFDEVERKIKPLTNIKIALSNDDHYRIGYIIATIDTLEVNLKKLRNDMNLHQHIWDDEKILDLFDRIKATNTVATSLIDSLKNYLHKS